MKILTILRAGLAAALMLAAAPHGQASMLQDPGATGKLRNSTKTGQPVLWTPAALGGSLVEWWDAGSGLAFNGSTVLSWTGVNGTVASQAIAASQPTYSASARNGKPGVILANQALYFQPGVAFPAGSSAHTIAASFYQTTNSTNPCVVGWGSTAQGKYRWIGGSGNTMLFDTYGNSQTVTIAVQNTDRFLFETLTNDPVAPVSTMTVDGGTLASKTLTYVSTSPNSSNGCIGKGPGTFNGTIQQIVVLSRIATLTEQQKIEGWESWWDGKAGSNLPSGHPFKLAAPLTSDP